MKNQTVKNEESAHLFTPLQILHFCKTCYPYSNLLELLTYQKSLSDLTTTVLDSADSFPHPGVGVTPNLFTALVVMPCNIWPLGNPVHSFLCLFMLFLRFFFVKKCFSLCCPQFLLPALSCLCSFPCLSPNVPAQPVANIWEREKKPLWLYPRIPRAGRLSQEERPCPASLTYSFKRFSP